MENISVQKASTQNGFLTGVSVKTKTTVHETLLQGWSSTSCTCYQYFCVWIKYPLNCFDNSVRFTVTKFEIGGNNCLMILIASHCKQHFLNVVMPAWCLAEQPKRGFFSGVHLSCNCFWMAISSPWSCREPAGWQSRWAAGCDPAAARGMCRRDPSNTQSITTGQTPESKERQTVKTQKWNSWLTDS